MQDSSTLHTARVGEHHRVLGMVESDTITWIWIGTHATYDQLTRGL
ncbi:MAG: hypothetical protein ABI972_07695 [Acidobacteriota bacterium]